MKILLISDTHGDISRVADILEYTKDIEMIIHCGDCQSDMSFLERHTEIPIVSIEGNCDSHRRDRKVVETPAGKLLITHGHFEAVGFTCNNLIFAAEEEGDCIAVCYGHTHVPHCEDVNGLWLVNPGSLTEPRGGSRPSYAILCCEEDRFQADIMDYDTFMQTQKAQTQATRSAEDTGQNASGSSTAKKKKVTGGFLRNLLNYSDRF